MDAETLKGLLHHSHATRKEKMDLTQDEVQSISDAFEKEEFRKLFFEYMQEVNDPKYKEETEKYLNQLEKENNLPENKKLLKPEPVFCIKAIAKDGTKVFINVCQSNLVDESTPTVAVNPSTGKQGASWNLPYALGGKRNIKVHQGKDALAIDIAFAPTTLIATSNAQFKELVVSTCLDSVVQRIEKEMDNESAKVLKAAKFKGGKPPMMMVDASTTKTSQESDSRTSSTERKEEKEEKVVAKEENEIPRPEYKIVHRGEFDLSSFMTSPLDGNRTIAPKQKFPKELVVTKNMRDANLDVSESNLKLSVGKLYYLSLQLPYTVNDDEGSAKFNKITRQLVVTLPVTGSSQDIL